VSKLCVSKLCVSKLWVCKAGGGTTGGRREEDGKTDGMQNQKQEPHTKMWGKKWSNFGWFLGLPPFWEPPFPGLVAAAAHVVEIESH
jgi:hypothetical protein